MSIFSFTGKVTGSGSGLRTVMIASTEGGVEIESVPQDQLLKAPIDVYEGLFDFQARAIAYGLGFEGDAQELLERDDLARAVFLGTEGG